MSGWTQADIDRRNREWGTPYHTKGIGLNPFGNAEKERMAVPKPRRGSMNKLEARFANEVLRPQRVSCEIIWWDFEPFKVRLADGAWYTPDFAAIDTVGLVLFECKGFWREAARVRIKVAADKYPFRFVAVTYDRKTGEWQYENFTGRGQR